MSAVGSFTVTVADVGAFTTRYTWAWTSSAGGAVSGNPLTSVRRGLILQVKFVPGTGGNQPTNNYTVALNDTDGLDVLGGVGQGTNLVNTGPQVKVPLYGASATALFFQYFNDGTQQLDLVVAGAGASKQGSVIVWVQ